MRIIPSRRHDPETSHLGEEDVRWRAGSQKHRLLDVYIANGALSDEEAARLAELSPRSCWWKRCSELREEGLICPVGQVMGTAGSMVMTCKITERGERILNQLSS